MIKIEKTTDGYHLYLGEKQRFPMEENDLKNLHHCLTKTIQGEPEDAPTTHFRIPNDEQFQVKYYNDGRNALWIGEQKWHLNPKEERHILTNLNELLGKNGPGQPEKEDLPIWLHREGSNEGPYSLEQARHMLAEGKADKETHACHPGAKSWMKLGDLV